MQFTTHANTSNAKAINGTHLQGHINCSYDRITEAFGYQLSEGFDDYKSDAEWHIFFNDGTVATIYNYKNGRNYLGDAGKYPEEITYWNIGGHDQKAVEKVMRVLGLRNIKSMSELFA
jgi:hypothetical protein